MWKRFLLVLYYFDHYKVCQPCYRKSDKDLAYLFTGRWT